MTSVRLPRAFALGWGVVFLITFAMSVFAGLTYNPPKAEAIGLPFVDLPTPCDVLPDGAAERICDSATNPGRAAGELIGQIPGIPSPNDVLRSAVGTAANYSVGIIINEVAQLEADAVTWLLKIQGQLVTDNASPDLREQWFTRTYALLYFFAALLATALFGLKLTQAASRGDPVMVGNIFIAVVVFALAASVLPALVTGLVYVFDKEVTPGLISATSGSLNQTLASIEVDFTKEITPGNNPLAPILVPLFALAFGFLGGLISLFLIVVRYMMLPFGTILVLFGLAMNVGLDWGSDALRRSVQFLLGWIMYVPALGVILLLGTNMLRESSNYLVSVMAAVVLCLGPILALWFTFAVAKHRIEFKPVDRTVSAVRNWKLLTSRR